MGKRVGAERVERAHFQITHEGAASLAERQTEAKQEELYGDTGAGQHAEKHEGERVVVLGESRVEQGQAGSHEKDQRCTPGDEARRRGSCVHREDRHEQRGSVVHRRLQRHYGWSAESGSLITIPAAKSYRNKKWTTAKQWQKNIKKNTKT